MDLQNPNNGETASTDEPHLFFDDIDSSCSTPYVSAPSSPGRGPCPGAIAGFFYSAPASPMHFAISSHESSGSHGSFEFEFSARFGFAGSGSAGSMTSADELFLNGQIRPMKLSSHLERPQVLAPLLDLEDEDDGDIDDSGNLGKIRGRDLSSKDKSLRRRTRSMSPLRNAPFQWIEDEEKQNKNGEENGSNKIDELSTETTPSVSASSSRSSSAGRSSKRWIFLKDFLRSKSEGRSNNKFWPTMAFSPAAREKKPTNPNPAKSTAAEKKPRKGVGKRPSAHELHYTTKRAQAEEMRKKTYLPYRQGLLGCLGFSSKGYGAMNGLARAWNPVSSR